MKFNHCSSRRFLQEEAPFRNNPSPSVTFSPDPHLNATSMASTPAMKKPFKLPNVPFDSSMALTVLILVTALFFLAFFSVYLRRLSSSSSFSSSTSPRRPTSASSPPPPSSSSRSCFSKGLDASTIKSLPQVPYGAAAKHPIDCPICLAEFDENDTVKMIPHCGHVFHPTCLDTWLSSHVTCPLCRSTRICVGSGEEVRLAVAQEDGDRSSVSAFGENLTVDQGDTLREVGSLGVRRTCSCSSLGNRACLQRSTSL